ncbi:uncharacterized protein LOC129712217 [Leucoraja erinacea]|uniref:uncharacterized protein LOC129712217 n=1 Tax=Leucoraja erinaceus TaxID=7782 RepID=UPI00245608AC|nr:uncharacterized protein LOC129712217 [Leucoraja erinacea]
MWERVEFIEINLDDPKREDSKTDFINPAFQPDCGNEEHGEQGAANYLKTNLQNESVHVSWETLIGRAGACPGPMWLIAIGLAVILTVTIGGSLITFTIQLVIQKSTNNHSWEVVNVPNNGNKTSISLFTASPSATTSSSENIVPAIPGFPAATAPSRTSMPSPCECYYLCIIFRHTKQANGPILKVTQPCSPEMLPESLRYFSTLCLFSLYSLVVPPST